MKNMKWIPAGLFVLAVVGCGKAGFEAKKDLKKSPNVYAGVVTLEAREERIAYTEMNTEYLASFPVWSVDFCVPANSSAGSENNTLNLVELGTPLPKVMDENHGEKIVFNYSVVSVVESAVKGVSGKTSSVIDFQMTSNVKDLNLNLSGGYSAEFKMDKNIPTEPVVIRFENEGRTFEIRATVRTNDSNDTLTAQAVANCSSRPDQILVQKLDSNHGVPVK